MEKEEILDKFLEFLRDFYYNDIISAINEGKKSISVDFGELDKFNTDLADYLLDNPEEVLAILENVTKQIDLPSEEQIKIRFINLPENRETRIRNIRTEHIGKLISVDGIVKRASEVRPEVSEAIYECLECGKRLSVIQTEIYMRGPIGCDCGNRKNFRLVEQKLYDARWVVAEEPFEITTGERPSEIRIFLKEDLTSPRLRNKTDPGNRIKVVGILKQLQRRIKGTKSRQMEIYIDANSVESLEIEWEELEISPEDEKRIVELSKDPQVYEKLIASIAPALYGMEEIKEAIVLQLFSGEPHVQKDRSRVRGDIHILLVGDPSTAKSALMKVVSGLIPRGRYVSGKGVSVDFDDPIIFREDGIIKTDLIGRVIDKYYTKNQTGFVSNNKKIDVPCFDSKTLKIRWMPVTKLFRHFVEDDIFKILLRTGREVRATSDHSIFTIENRKITAKKACDLKVGDILLIPNKLPQNDRKITKIDVWKELRKLSSKEIKFVEENSGFIKSKFSSHKIPRVLEVNEDLMRFLGYYIADGSIGYDSKDQFKIKFDIDRNDKETIDDIKSISKKLFGLEAKEYKRTDSKCNNIYIHDKIVCLILKDVIKVARDAHTKKVPDIVFNVSPELQKWFLYALVKGDYGVTVSKTLMSDILYLLLLNGMVGSFTRKDIDRIVKFKDGHESKISDEYYELKSPKIKKILASQIRNSNLHSRVPLEFFQSYFIRMLGNNGYVRISDSGFKKINSKFKKLMYDRLKIIDNGIDAGRLSRIISRNIKSTKQYLQNLMKKGWLNKEGEMYKISDKGKKLLEEIEFLNKLRSSDLAFLKIKKIEKIKPTTNFVYDFSVEGDENFVAGFGGVLCHNTGAGLTATVVRDEEFLGGWVLEAGALVMCNRSLIAIDEFEKIEKTDQIALHEAMEQNTISIAKANIVATLPAQTSILGGGNPKLGRFDPYLPIKEQIDVPETILTRFDLKFALRDVPNPELDAKVAEHILQARHYGEEEIKPIIDPDFFKKYIVYARKNCHPKLIKVAGDEIKDFFVKMREKVLSEGDAPIPITLRQYEALIRMAEASAKIQMRSEVTKEDALRSINLMKASLRQFGFDPETGRIDIDRVEGHVTATQRGRIRIMLDVINELSGIFGKEIPLDEIRKSAREQGVDNAELIIRQMRDEGLLIEPRPGFIQKI